MSEKVLESRRVYDGKVVNLRVDTVRFENGASGAREVVEHHGAVAVVPMIDETRLLLVSQYRTAAGRTMLEIPAGTLNPGEEPEACARREIVEETQFEAREMEKLFAMFVAPGYSTEKITVFVATHLTPRAGVGDDDEFIDVRTIRLTDAIAMIDSGEIEDAKTIAGLLAVERRRSLGAYA